MKDITKYKYYEGGRTVGDVGAVEGFAFTRRRRGCFCVPAAGESCSHASWTGEIDRGSVQRAKPAQAGGATRVTRQAARRGGPSATYRDSIDENSLLTMPGDEDDETADGETIWFARATGPAEQNEHTFDCGPSRLIKNHYSVPVEWLNLDELTDEHAIFSVWPTEQDRIATSHLLPMPDLVWEEREDGRFYMSRAQYDACNEQL